MPEKTLSNSELSAGSSLDKLKKADNAYYNTSKPIMSDAAYDKLRAQAKQEYPKDPYWKRVGAPPTGKANSPLPIRMQSLDKINPAHLEEWIAKQPGKKFWSVVKFDGNALLLTYKDGKFVKAQTRGDGNMGRDVTLAVTYTNIPKEVKGFSGYIAGEAIISQATWKSLLAKKIPDTNNPRNYANGILGRKTDHSQAINLHFLAYAVYTLAGKRSSKFSVEQKWLAAKGFRSVLAIGATEFTAKELPDLENELKWKSGYESDGIVIIPEDLGKAIEVLGEGERTPPHSVAVKPAPEDQDSKVGVIEKIEWNLGKSKTMNPVAILKNPLDFKGAKVQRASAYNAKNVKDMGLAPGVRIQVIRSGDVIPRIMTSLNPSKSPKLPTVCPACDSKLQWTQSKVDLFCPNKNCGGAHLSHLQDYFHGLDLEGVSHVGIAKLYDIGVKTIPAFYQLTDSQLTKAGFGNRKETIRAAFMKTLKGAKLAKVMALSGVFSEPDFALGETRLASILRVVPFNTLAKPPEDLLAKINNISGIGPRAAALFVARLPKWWVFWKQISPNWQAPKQTGTAFKNQTICFSGFRNSAWAKLVELQGGTYKDNLSKETTLLVTDSNTSTKASRAKELGIKIMSPTAFAQKYGIK